MACTPTNQPITKDTFKQAVFVTDNKDSALTQLFFEPNKIIFSISQTGLKHKDTVKLPLSDFVPEKKNDTTVTATFYDKDTPGYDAKYGTQYIVLHNASLLEPTKNRSAWLMRIEYTKENIASTNYTNYDALLFSINDKQELVTNEQVVFKKK